MQDNFPVISRLASLTVPLSGTGPAQPVPTVL